MAFAETGWLLLTKRLTRNTTTLSWSTSVSPRSSQTPFPRMSMADAYQILKNLNYKLPPEKKGDLDPGAERALGDYVKEHYGNDFVFVTDWPFTVRPFYHMLYEDNPNLTKSFDLLGRGLEITTGAQREHRYEVLAKQALEKGLTLEPIQTYSTISLWLPASWRSCMGLSRH